MPSCGRLRAEDPALRRAAADVHRPLQALHRRDGHLQGHDGRSPSTPSARRGRSTTSSFLARYHYYDGIVFHRIIPGFVVQGGDPTGRAPAAPGYRFEDELPKPGRYELGSLAMANAGPDTNGSQFFVISGPTAMRLPPLYSLFGQLVSGRTSSRAIDALGTKSGSPKEKVVIESVTITEAGLSHAVT